MELNDLVLIDAEHIEENPLRKFFLRHNQHSLVKIDEDDYPSEEHNKGLITNVIMPVHLEQYGFKKDEDVAVYIDITSLEQADLTNDADFWGMRWLSNDEIFEFRLCRCGLEYWVESRTLSEQGEGSEWGVHHVTTQTLKHLIALDRSSHGRSLAGNNVTKLNILRLADEGFIFKMGDSEGTITRIEFSPDNVWLATDIGDVNYSMSEFLTKSTIVNQVLDMGLEPDPSTIKAIDEAGDIPASIEESDEE